MGCASSKKRTTSIDDLTGQAKNKEPAAPSSANKNKNGQVANNANDVVIRKEASKQTSAAPPSQNDNAIQIPGTHKSFLAPDGIPFIDEDVDEDGEIGGGDDANTIPAGGAIIKPDVNKNVVKGPTVPDQQQPKDQPASSVSVTKDVNVKPAVPAAVVVDERHHDDVPPELPVSGPPSEPSAASLPPTTVVSSSEKPELSEEQAEEERKKAVAMDILSKELDIFASSEHHETATTITLTESAPVSAEGALDVSQPVRSVTPDDQEKAAVKIQAGIRGYRDRMRVKAIRAAKETADETGNEMPDQPDDKPVISLHEDMEAHSEQVHDADPEGVKISVDVSEPNPTDSIHDDDPDDPDKQRAATKIQASFKGYKTRKELGKIKK